MLRKICKHCHSEAVAAAPDEESRIVHAITQSEILRCAQDDSIQQFFRELQTPVFLLYDQTGILRRTI
jgi:hypothetical protein